jgi:hypothetical protein
MAYLRPLNSSEANVYVIRFTSPIVSNSNLTALSGSYTGYYGVNSSSFANPTSDLLPSGFSFMIGNNAKGDYRVEFGTMTNKFTEDPTVSISINKKNSSDANINKYRVMITDATTTSVNFIVIDSSTNLAVTPYTSSSSIICPIFNMIFVGSVMSGATFAISNRGWNVPESSVNKLYTYQNVGIGTGKVEGTLNLSGTFVNPAYIASYTDGDSTLGTIATNIVANYLTLLTIPTDLAEDRYINLPAGKNGQIVRLCITNDNFSDTAGNNKFYIDGSCLNTGTNFVLADNDTISKLTELYYDTTISPPKWSIVNYTHVTPGA